MEEGRKEKKIKKNISVFKRIFKDLEKDKKEIAQRLYEKAAFMDATLEELQEDINQRGSIIETTNGNGFDVEIENPSQKAYNALIKNYNSVMKTLADMIPDSGGGSDEFTDFLKRNKR